MSSPYGHGLIGLGLFNLCYPRWFASRRKTLLLYGLVVLGVCSPDLDFLPGIFYGNPARFHHGPFHSLGLAVGLSLTVGILAAIIRIGSSFSKTAGFVFALIFSHLVLDFFTEDLKPPYGFPLFWPVSETYVISSWPFLPYVERDLTNPVFWRQMVRVFILESLFCLSFFFLSWRLKGSVRGK
jgi:inner membrane protein